MNKVYASLFSFLLVFCACASDKSLQRKERFLKGLNLAKEKQLPLIFRLGISTNSFGGVRPRFTIINTGGREIKYLSFTLTPYNAVGDAVASSIGGESETTLRITGPIKPATEQDLCLGEPPDDPCKYMDAESDRWHYHLEPVWYNNAIKCIAVSNIRIDYSDKTSKQFKGKSVLEMNKAHTMFSDQASEEVHANDVCGNLIEYSYGR